MAGRGKKKEIDPEILMKLKFKAKCQFRALYRLVAANAYWMFEDVDQYEGDDVKRRVQQAVRSKKKKQLLNIRDKALLNKPAHDRTDAEKKYLYRILGGLKCFKKYPNHVKKKLAAVTYFKYYGPGRVIVRQHQEAHAMYFIVTGEVVVSQMIWDGLLQEYISTNIGVMHPGEMFGEVSLLHNIPRTATVSTSGHCELLALLKEDFKHVLQASVQKQWDEVHHAMTAFTYFDALDDIGLREGCIVAKMKSYERNETLLGDGQGVPNYVYFVLSGRCQMIESIQVVVTTHIGKNHYSLYDPYVPKEESEQDLDIKYFEAYKNLIHRSENPSVFTEKETTISDLKEQSATKSKTESILKPDSSSKHARVSGVSQTVPVLADARRESVVSHKGSLKSELIMLPSENEAQPRDSVRLSVVPEIVPPVPELSVAAGLDSETKLTRRPALAHLKTYFMQVIQYNPGSTFGFGENMRDRRIIALTPVDCMLIPLVWLLQRNTANIWTRIKHFLEKKIPDKKTLFKEFVNERRWQEYRGQLVEDILARSKTVNFTSLHDVPYSIRMEEMHDV